MTMNLARKDLDVSETHSKDDEMSSVNEMHCLVHEAANFAAPTGNWKDRVQAASRAFGLGWERAKAFYYRDARRVDAEEMDRARRAIAKLRAEARDRKNAEHLAWLNRSLAHLQASDPEFFGQDISRLERALAGVGALDGAVGSSDEGGR